MYINKKQNKHIVSMYMFNKWKKTCKTDSSHLLWKFLYTNVLLLIHKKWSHVVQQKLLFHTVHNNLSSS